MTQRHGTVAISCIVAGLFLSAVAIAIDRAAYLLSYLVIAVTIAAIPAGSLAVLFMTYLARGHWTQGLHVPLTAAALTAPVAGLLFVPVLIGLPGIYPWAEGSSGDVGGLKGSYLTASFFVLRTVMYFAAWSGLALWAHRSWGNLSRMAVAASVGLIVYAITGSLAGVDWLQSLTPQFHSSIYGLLFMVFQILTGYAFALVMVLRAPHALTHRYGAILLAALLLWAYLYAMQYIVIWSADLPAEVVWYLQRESGVWGVAFWSLIGLQFIAPFFALLSQNVRQTRQPLFAIAAITLMLRPLEAAVLTLPGSLHGGWVAGLGLVAAMLALGAAWWVAFAAVLMRIAAEVAGQQLPGLAGSRIRRSPAPAQQQGP
jgi:hypothetical protein